MSSYKTVKGECGTVYEIQKSKFISYCKHIENIEQAAEYISEIKKKHSDATHNCFAYVLQANSALQKFSDDGEPSGTAGMPILEVILKQGLTNIVVVVTRYFGGIKLGGGGLIRAYSLSCANALSLAKKCNNTLCGFYSLFLDYDIYNKVQSKLSDINIIKTEFSALVEIEFVSAQADIYQKIVDLCSGRCKLEHIKNDYYDFKIEE